MYDRRNQPVQIYQRLTQLSGPQNNLLLLDTVALLNVIVQRLALYEIDNGVNTPIYFKEIIDLWQIGVFYTFQDICFCPGVYSGGHLIFDFFDHYIPS